MKRVGDENLHFFGSDAGSDIQLVFTPGIFGGRVWRHQLRYFSKKFDTFAFDTTLSNRGFTDQMDALEQVLGLEEMENVVLIGQGPGNSIVQAFEEDENVVATVLTGVKEDYRVLNREIYAAISKVGCMKPKLLKKFFFSDMTDYEVVQKFTEDVEPVDYDDYRSFVENHSLREPVKQAMIIHSREDVFSSKEFASSFDDAAVSVIDSGSFSFYEKPQEYNKALHDFLTRVQSIVEEREIYKAASENRSLKEFEASDQDRKVKLRNDSRPDLEG